MYNYSSSSASNLHGSVPQLCINSCNTHTCMHTYIQNLLPPQYIRVVLLAWCQIHLSSVNIVGCDVPQTAQGFIIPYNGANVAHAAYNNSLMCESSTHSGMIVAPSCIAISAPNSVPTFHNPYVPILYL